MGGIYSQILHRNWINYARHLGKRQIQTNANKFEVTSEIKATKTRPHLAEERKDT